MSAASIVLARGPAPVEQSIGGWRAFITARAAWRRLSDLSRRDPVPAIDTMLPRQSGVVELHGVGCAPSGQRATVRRDVGVLEA